MAAGALKFKNAAVARQPQELGRLRVLGGAEVGSVFIITAPRVSIGRGEENEIAVLDLKLSRRHAEIVQTPQGMMIRDLGSSNGMAINGQPLKQWFLKTGDKVGMGSTVFEYLAPDAGPLVAVPTPSSSAPVGSGLSGLTRFISLPKAGPAAPAPGTGGGNLFERNKKLMLTFGALMVLAYLMPQAEYQVKKRRKQYEVPAELAAGSGLKSFLPSGVDSEAKKRADAYFNEGYREYIEKNYLRAKASFEVALQVMPGHEMARVYRDNVVKAMDTEAADIKKLAKRDEEGGRWKSALERYDSIRRMYFRDQTNPLYKEADAAYLVVEKKIKEAAQ